MLLFPYQSQYICRNRKELFMHTLELYSLPRIDFAHAYQADFYKASFFHKSNFMEISYMEEGQLDFQTEDQRFSHEKGDILFLNYQMPLHCISTSFHRHLTIGVCVDWRYLEDHSKGLCIPRITKHCTQSRLILPLIDRIIKEQSLYQDAPSKGAGAFINLLCELDKINRSDPESPLSGQIRYALKAKQYISEHINEPLTQMQIADYLNITPGYLCDIFKKTQGIPLMYYINRTKLERIRSLMEKEHLHLCEAAPLFGYADPNYVSRLYKKIFSRNITDHGPL